MSEQGIEKSILEQFVPTFDEYCSNPFRILRIDPEKINEDMFNMLDWDFDKYNGDVDSPRAFLKSAGAKSVTVPYRANRAVIFDSDLFHETDTIRFRDGYENRRINVTLLYGRRDKG